MGTIDAADVITLTEADLDPHVTHEETRHLLTGPGLPSVGTLVDFGVLGGRPLLRRVAELVDDAEQLAEELRDQLVIGALRSLDQDLASLLLDGATGRISTTCVFPRDPGLMGRSPLAPSLGALLRFAAVTEELTASRGRFASTEYGAEAVAATSERLSSAFAAIAGEDGLAAYWRMAALIRPLARIARPGAGLRLDLPPGLLDDDFGSGAVMHFEDVDFPCALTHEPTRRFLREVGLPEDGFWYTLDTDVPLATLAEYHADEPDVKADLPESADRLIRLGYLLEDSSLVVDGATGAVLYWSEPEEVLRPLNADISTLAFTVWLVHREQALAEDHGLTQAYEELAATMVQTLAAVDPIACDRTPTAPWDDGWRYWREVFEDEANGGL